ncbi:trypsin-like serine protease [Halobacteriovorax sp.]|uniref:trypsin-like serine protease n=1 Tax=Halobacteriovorax sp. TaxID=2020862 RepID=UPI003561955F
MQLKLTLTFLVLLTSCSGRLESISSEKAISSKIFGGERVDDGKWQSVVSISKLGADDKVDKSFCTGTLIDEKTVLSAAHCFKRNKLYYINGSVITTDNIDATERTYTKIKDIRIHPNYLGEDSPFDFALIDLEESAGVDVSNLISPSSTGVASEGSAVALVGFGKIEDGTNGVKFEVETNIREDLGDEFIAGGDGKDTCAGDSGGPVFIKNNSGDYELFGVTSRTPDDANAYCGDKTIYGKVSTAMKWVRAEKIIDRALELDSLESIELLKKAKLELPKYFKTYKLLGELYLRNNMLTEAVKNLMAASSLNPQDVKSLNLLREVYIELGNEEAEISILRRLLVLEPSNQLNFKRLESLGERSAAEIARGIGYFKMGSNHFAIMDLEAHKEDSSAAFLLAFLKFKEMDSESALELLRGIPSDDLAIVDLRDSRGDTFLMTAVFEDKKDIINEILRFKPNLKLLDSYGNNLAQVAWWARGFDLVKLFVSLGLEWNPDDYFDQFMVFLRNEYIDEVRFMLEMGVDLNIVGPRGETAINLARETKNQELIELVESYGKEKSIK